MSERLTRPLPWQQQQWQGLRDQIANNQLHHALILSGSEGLGKVQFAHLLAQAILCQRPDKQLLPCQNCDACHQFNAGFHADFWHLGLTGNSRQLKIDDVRALCEHLQLTSQSGGYKVVIIESAECLNVAASNSLLKTLEEPSGTTLILLVTHRIKKLLPTVRSRCVTTTFVPPSVEQGMDWLGQQLPESSNLELLLKLTGGSPVGARDLAQSGELEKRAGFIAALLSLAEAKADPVHEATNWSDEPLLKLLHYHYLWLCDLSRIKLDCSVDLLTNVDYLDSLHSLAKRVGLDVLMESLLLNQNLATLAESQVATQSLLEQLFIDWAKSTYPHI